MDDLSGREIRGYQLRQMIGAGGSGAVYLAYQPEVKREVAIKIVLPEYANRPYFIRNFKVEAELVARLEHPYIVPLYDYWRDPTGAYIVMRYLRGGNLQDSLKAHAWELPDAARLLDQVASALTIAHRNGVIHQDLKTANILLDEDQNGYLSDFGIAKDLKEDLDMSYEPDGMSKRGSPEYMAPESLLRANVDTRSDIYSLGVVLYEILTGVKPFQQTDDEELVRSQLYDQLPRLQEQRPDLPETLNIVVQRATDKNPKRRYTTPLDMAENFRQFVNVAPPVTVSTAPAADTVVVPAASKAISLEELERLIEPSNPYKGLKAFEEADANDFFGREGLIDDLYERLRRVADGTRFLAVIGASGSGKSSVVKAGLIPLLRRRAGDWYVTEMTPGVNPLRELEEALLRVAMGEAQGVGEVLRRDPSGLHTVLQRLFSDGTELVLVIDQFEEAFTLTADEADRVHFLASLAYAVNAPDSLLRVVLTLRADFYDRPLLYPGFAELVRDGAVTVLPLSAEELERAITKPAERAGLKLEDGLVPAIITEVSGQPGALPLLQYALTELYNHRKGTLLTLAAYRSTGGVSGAMTLRADELYLNATVEGKQAIKRLFLQLVTLGEGTEDTRRRLLRSTLLTLGDAETMESVIDRFGKYRLLAFDNDEVTRLPTVEIAHEALIRKWARLREWLDENRDALRMQRQLSNAADEWHKSERDRSFLAAGARLAQFEALRDAEAVALRPIEAEYLAASVERRSAAQRQRQLGVAVLVVIAFITTGLALLAYVGQQRAEAATRIARSRELASTAQTVRDQPDLALLLSLEALNTADTFEARSNLVSTLQTLERVARVLPGHTGAVRAVAYGDGYMVTGSADGTVRVWDRQTDTTVYEFDADTERINAVALSPDGSWVAAGGDEGIIRVWSLTDGSLRYQLEGHTGAVNTLAVSADGRQLASAAGEVIIWDMESGTVQHTFEAASDESTVNAVAFSPDGSLIAAGSSDAVIRFWDAAAGAPAGEALTAPGAVFSLAFSPDGRVLASAGVDVQLWNMRARQPLGEPFSAHTEAVRALQFDTNGQRLLSVGTDRQIVVWDWTSGTVLERLRTPRGERFYSAMLSPDSRTLLVGSDNPNAYVYTFDGGTMLTRPASQDAQPVSAVGFNGEAALISTSPLVEGGSGHTLYHRDTAVSVATGEVVTSDFSPDGRWFASVDVDGTLTVVDTNSPDAIQTITAAHPTAIFALAFNADGQRLATGGGDGQIKLWSLVDDTWTVEDMVLTGHTDRVFSLAFSADGSRLASSSRDFSLRLWNLANGQPDGDPLTVPDQLIISLVFSPDDRWLVSGGRDNLLLLWDLETRSVAQRIADHRNWVTDVMFNPATDQGRWLLASTSRDQTVLLWELEDGVLRQLGQRLIYPQEITTGAFAPDGSHMIVGGANGFAAVTDAGWELWRADACTVANRSLTEAEWALYLRDEPYRLTCSQESS